jgi:hypothetical protein
MEGILVIQFNVMFMPPNYRLKLTAPSVTPLAGFYQVEQAACPRPAA